MSREIIRFKPNEPVTVSLERPGIPTRGFAGPQVQYFLLNNRMMYLDLETAHYLDLLHLKVGELVSITLREEPGKKPWWDLARIRAVGASVPPKPPQLPAPPVENPAKRTGTLNPGVLRSVPDRKPPHTHQPEPPPPGGLRLTKTPPPRLDYETAFRECLRIVTEGLSAAGEQWSDEAKQAMVSTLVIQAGRENAIRFSIPEPGERVA